MSSCIHLINNFKRICFLVCMACICCSSLPAFAQADSTTRITLDAKGMPLLQFFNQLEAQSSFRFYYDASQLDTLRADYQANAEPLNSLLQKVLWPLDCFYAIDAAGAIYITRNKPVTLNLPQDYFHPVTKSGIIKPADSLAFAEPSGPSGNDRRSALDGKLYIIGEKVSGLAQSAITLVGYLKDAATGEPIVGASVFIEKPRIGVTTDQYGYYALTIPKGRYILNIQSIGMRDIRRQVLVYSDDKMNVEMQGTVMSLKGVTISAQKRSNVKSTQMGVQKLDMATIKRVPVVFGEADVLRAVTTLPGVKTVGEASTGLNVRGGAADQNLILLNEGTIYNPAHFFGMFAAFNPELIKDVELFKGTIPPKYGGRLASVLAVNTREGSNKKITGSAGLGLLTSRINLEGPLVKDKSSFILGARTTYSNWLLNLLPDQYKKSKASFYDMNLGITHEINKKNTLYLSGYFSNDRFNLNSDTVYNYGNRNLSIKLKHIFNNKLNSTVAVGYDRYAYGISSDAMPEAGSRLKFDINQSFLKTHFNYYLSSKHTLDFGLNSLYYSLHPGNYQPYGAGSLVVPEKVPAEQALESAIYLNDHYNVSSRLALDAGIRYAVYNYLGPHDQRIYAPGLPKTEDNLLKTEIHGRGSILKTYQAPEFRFAARYAINDSFSIKAGFSTQQQFIHSLSNTTAMAPTDIWKLSDDNIRPQQGSQVSLGVYRNFRANTVEASVEVYYKKMEHYLDYKSGAELVMNQHVETEVKGARGKAYGVELLVKKLSGKLNGWISYTWSRVFLQMNDPNAGEVINKGNWYPSNYDKPHDLTIISNYRFSHRFSISLNGTYSTGRPITLPVGVFYFGGSYRTLYADRNAYRIPDYFRTDVSLNIEGNHKVHQKTHNSWTVGVYNLTGRKNPYSVYYVSENGNINGYKLSIFGNAIPYVNFNIKF